MFPLMCVLFVPMCFYVCVSCVDVCVVVCVDVY